MEIELGSVWVGNFNSGIKVKVLSVSGFNVRVKVISGYESKFEKFNLNMNYFLRAYTQEVVSEPQTLKESIMKEIAYDEGYNDGHNKAKEIITNLDEQERQAIYQEGYDSGRNQFVDDYGFSIDNATIQNLETIMYKKGLSDKEGINEAVKRQEFNKGFDKGSKYSGDLLEKNSLQAYNSGYNNGVEDTVAEFDLGNAFTDELQQEAYEKGFLAAVEEMTESCLEEELSEYEFGDDNLEEVPHPHYFKSVKHLDYIDIYMVCKLFEVDDSSHCTQHAIKKLLMAGKRGSKDKIKDIKEARDTLKRFLNILKESGEM